jgi:hypothetical protein
MEYLNRVFLTILLTIMVVVIFTTCMTFLGVQPADYQAYMYYVVAMAVLSMVLG